MHLISALFGLNAHLRLNLKIKTADSQIYVRSAVFYLLFFAFVFFCIRIKAFGAAVGGKQNQQCSENKLNI